MCHFLPSAKGTNKVRAHVEILRSGVSKDGISLNVTLTCHPERSASEVEILRSGMSGAKSPSYARWDLQSLFAISPNSKLL